MSVRDMEQFNVDVVTKRISTKIHLLRDRIHSTSSISSSSSTTSNSRINHKESHSIHSNDMINAVNDIRSEINNKINAKIQPIGHTNSTIKSTKKSNNISYVSVFSEDSYPRWQANLSNYQRIRLPIINANSTTSTTSASTSHILHDTIPSNVNSNIDNDSYNPASNKLESHPTNVHTSSKYPTNTNTIKQLINKRQQLKYGNQELFDILVEPCRLEVLRLANNKDTTVVAPVVPNNEEAEDENKEEALIEDSSLKEQPTERSAEGPFDSSSLLTSTPQSVYIAACLTNSLLPLSLSIFNSTTPLTILDLSHFNLGDIATECLITSLTSVVTLHTLLLTDNNLSDSTLTYIILFLHSNLNVTNVSLSYNFPREKTITALTSYLTYKACSLKSLNVSYCQLQDEYCLNIFSSLVKNTSLLHLYIQGNNLGLDSTTSSSNASGIESLSHLLRQIDTKLLTLDISWSYINIDNSIDLCDSILDNHSLVTLNLSNIRLGKESAVILGTSLSTNTGLVTVSLNNCNIDDCGTFVIISNARRCTTLSTIHMDGNPIGELGMRIILSLAHTINRSLIVTMNRCEITKLTPELFNYLDPYGFYNLQLSTGYGNALIHEMLLVVANDEKLLINSLNISSEDSSNSTSSVNISMHKVSKDRHLSSDEKTSLQYYTSIYHVTMKINTVYEKLNAYFNNRVKTPTDEFIVFLNSLGITHCESKHISYITGAAPNTVTVYECSLYLMYLRNESLSRIHDIKNETNIVVTQSPREAYHPPAEGKVDLEISESLETVSSKKCFTELQFERLLNILNNCDDRSIAIHLAIQGRCLHYKESLIVFKHMYNKSNTDIVVILSKILLYMASSANAIALLVNKIGYNIHRIHRLKTKIGPLYKCIMGHYNGYYHLNLRTSNDRECLRHLIQKSNSFNKHRKDNNLSDISQNPNWGCFRNIVYRKKSGSCDEEDEYILVNELFTTNCTIADMMKTGHVPRKGLIDFDFIIMESTTSTASTASVSHTMSISDDTLVNLLIQSNVIPKSAFASQYLTELNSFDTALHTYIYPTSVCRAIKTSFYDKLLDRRNEIYAHEKLSLRLQTGVSTTIATLNSITYQNSPVNTRSSIKKTKEYTDPSIKWVTSQVDIMSQVESIEYLFANTHLSCRQLAYLVNKFSCGNELMSDFGTYRVEIIMYLLSNIIDIENIYKVCKYLNTIEISCLIARIGFFNHMYNDNDDYTLPHELHLCLHEDRQIARLVLTKLSAVSQENANFIVSHLKEKQLILLEYTDTAEDWTTMPKLMKAESFSASNSNLNIAKVLRITDIETEVSSYLQVVHKWSPGLVQGYLNGASETYKTYFLADDSGSMTINDSTRFVRSVDKFVATSCSRWTELVEAIQFHASLAELAKANVVFRLLNNAPPITVGGANDNNSQSGYDKLMSALKIPPKKQTPLCFHFKEIIAEIKAVEPLLRETNKLIKIIIATDGEASDGDVAEAMLPLKDLPVHIVLRLCTSDDTVVEYWDGIEASTGIDFDVVDDLATEAKGVFEKNPWLVYTEPLQRLRETGQCTVLGEIDAKALTAEQIRHVCLLVYGPEYKDTLPDPLKDWKTFADVLVKADEGSPAIYSTITGGICYEKIMRKALKNHLFGRNSTDSSDDN